MPVTNPELIQLAQARRLNAKICRRCGAKNSINATKCRRKGCHSSNLRLKRRMPKAKKK
jgi:large subunit ribosomal protein L40e